MLIAFVIMMILRLGFRVQGFVTMIILRPLY